MGKFIPRVVPLKAEISRMVEKPEPRRRPEIVPTITAFSSKEYKNQLNKIKFAKRIHPDFTDGIFAPSRTINLIQAYWPDDVVIDLHVMYKKPAEHIETMISLKPNLVILHAESDGNLSDLFEQLKAVNIRTGLALLPETSVESVEVQIKKIDYVLVFGGRLGYQGSQLQHENLDKIKQVKDINPKLEVGWDGGINDANAAKVIEAGADVLNVGGFIQHAESPKKAYDKLVQIARSASS